MTDSKSKHHFYAILKGNTEDLIKRIPLSRELSDKLHNLFSEQEQKFLDFEEEIIFNGDYKVEGKEIFKIEDFQLPPAIELALKAPHKLEKLDLKNEGNLVKGFFSGIKKDNKETIANFHIHDSRKLLTKKFAIFFDGKTYTKLEDPGIILQNKLTAHYKDETLYFKSYHNTKRILNLDQYYKEATDTDLENFIDQEFFYLEDQEEFLEMADSVIRKKVALIQKNNVMEVIDKKSIIDSVEYLNNSIPPEEKEKKISIEVFDDQIKIPDNKKELKKLIRFLNEDYQETLLTRRKTLSNSKIYLPKTDN